MELRSYFVEVGWGELLVEEDIMELELMLEGAGAGLDGLDGSTMVLEGRTLEGEDPGVPLEPTGGLDAI